jgi:septum formation protein
MKTEIILASRSPRRQILLRQIGLRFRVHPSRIRERFNHADSAAKNVTRIAFEKASDVARHYKRGIIIGADTVVVLNGTLFAKPSSPAQARRMLRKLSGKEHAVYTGFALVDAASGASSVDYEKTLVRFRKLGSEEISRYVASGSPMDKAGAYGIQDDFGAVFVEKVNGCFYNVVGFPLPKFWVVYRKFVAHLKNKDERAWNERSEFLSPKRV